MNEDALPSNNLVFAPPEADKNPEPDGSGEGDGRADHYTQVDVSTVKAAISVGTTCNTHFLQE
jgi:hypothetical protein